MIQHFQNSYYQNQKKTHNSKYNPPLRHIHVAVNVRFVIKAENEMNIHDDVENVGDRWVGGYYGKFQMVQQEQKSLDTVLES